MFVCISILRVWRASLNGMRVSQRGLRVIQRGLRARERGLNVSMWVISKSSRDCLGSLRVSHRGVKAVQRGLRAGLLVISVAFEQGCIRAKNPGTSQPFFKSDARQKTDLPPPLQWQNYTDRIYVVKHC